MTFFHSPSAGCLSWPDWVPFRLLHYLMAVVVVLQFGAVRYGEELLHIGPAYMCFIFVGFLRFFHLGFLMTFARQGSLRSRLWPLASSCWPVTLIFIPIVSPSTNWELAGMLTYPFFPSTTARCIYVAGAVLMVFCLDRIGRSVNCQPLPELLSRTSICLYLFHPVIITVILQIGLASVMAVWLTTQAVSFVLVVVQAILCRRSEAGWEFLQGCHFFFAPAAGSKGRLLADGTQSGSEDSCSSSDDDEANISHEDASARRLGASA